MICDFCHEREAVIFMEQTSTDGSRRKINICLECAMERGISPDPKSIESSIGNLFRELANVSKKISERENKLGQGPWSFCRFQWWKGLPFPAYPQILPAP